MIFSAVYYRERARRAIDEVKDVRAAYTNLRASYATVLVRLDEANQREEALRAEIADLNQHVECMACDVADMERVVAAMTNGLRWFDPTEEAK